ERGAAVREVGVSEAQPRLRLLIAIGTAGREGSKEVQLDGGIATPPLADLGAGQRKGDAGVPCVAAVHPAVPLSSHVVRVLPVADPEGGVLGEERGVDDAANGEGNALAGGDILCKGWCRKESNYG